MSLPTQVSPTSYAADTANTRGTAVTAGTPAGTYSASFVQLASSTDYDAAGFFVHFTQSATGRYQCKIYVGASSSETEVCELIAISSSQASASIFVPVRLPAGSRVTAKIASSNASSVMYVHLTLVRGDSGDVTISRGRITTVTSGDPPDVDAGASANTKGSWVELIASTANDVHGYTLCLLGDPSCDTTNRTLFDVAVGGSGSEVIILADFPGFQEGFRSECRNSHFGPIWTRIPAGSRIAVRCQSSTATASARVPKVALILWE